MMENSAHIMLAISVYHESKNNVVCNSHAAPIFNSKLHILQRRRDFATNCDFANFSKRERRRFLPRSQCHVLWCQDVVFGIWWDGTLMVGPVAVHWDLRKSKDQLNIRMCARCIGPEHTLYIWTENTKSEVTWHLGGSKCSGRFLVWRLTNTEQSFCLI